MGEKKSSPFDNLVCLVLLGIAAYALYKLAVLGG